MDIKEKFIELTSRTYPHGKESDLRHLLPENLEDDEFGNLFIRIGETTTMFTSHLDTATVADCEITHVEEENFIKSNGKTILGADDKAGVVIMLNMIENNIPGLYYFFLGEEVGCQGSKKLSAKIKDDKINGINKVIAFDRKGYNSIITYQFGTRCCSDEFGTALSNELNKFGFSYKNDPSGLYTDSAQFIKIYPECTNISVGYFGEHTFNEKQDIVHLEKLAIACLSIDWENLPIKRDPNVTEYDYADYDYIYGDYNRHNYGQYGKYGRYAGFPENSRKEEVEKSYFYDEKFERLSSISYNRLKKIIAIDLHPDRIELEKQMLSDLFSLLELSYNSFTWNGLILKVNYELRNCAETTRDDLLEFLPEFEYNKYIINNNK